MPQEKTVFALLSNAKRNVTARDVIREVARTGHSVNIVARAIVDLGLGQVELARLRPQDQTEERIIRLRTSEPERALETLSRMLEIEYVSQRFEDLFPLTPNRQQSAPLVVLRS